MSPDPRRWLPTSKMTAVIVSGCIYTWFIWVLENFYGLRIEPWVVAANQAWIVGLIGWSITERRS